MSFFSRNKNTDGHDTWVSYTDLMAGFLVVFIIITALIFNEYMKIRKTNLQNLITSYSEVFVDDPNVRHEIDTARGSIILTHKNDRKSLFKKGYDSMEPEFASYIKKIGKPLIRQSMELWKTLSLNDMELRIEGHTDPIWENRITDYGFKKNLELSSQRANYVYRYMLDSLNLNAQEREFMMKNMISVGYSYSRRLSEGNVNDRSLDPASRRVEFRIISK